VSDCILNENIIIIVVIIIIIIMQTSGGLNYVAVYSGIGDIRCKKYLHNSLQASA